MITKLEIFRENSILVPRNLEGRQEKKAKNNIKLLQQEIIDGDFEINDDILKVPSHMVKVKEIKGTLIVKVENIPTWVKNIIVDNNYSCSHIKDIDLTNSPITVRGSVFLRNCNLQSLENCPKYIGGDFNCSDNRILSLEHGPKEVGGHYDCSENALNDLKGCINNVSGTFMCNANYLNNLIGGPVSVGADYVCMSNNLNSLKGVAKVINGNFDCSFNDLISIDEFPEYFFGNFRAFKNPTSNEILTEQTKKFNKI